MDHTSSNAARLTTKPSDPASPESEGRQSATTVVFYLSPPRIASFAPTSQPCERRSESAKIQALQIDVSRLDAIAVDVYTKHRSRNKIGVGTAD
jgi:hypothetical protein